MAKVTIPSRVLHAARFEMFFLEGQRHVVAHIRNQLNSWCGTFCEGRLTLRSRSPLRNLETFLKNSYELHGKDLNSKKSVLQSVGRIFFATRKLEF